MSFVQEVTENDICVEEMNKKELSLTSWPARRRSAGKA